MTNKAILITGASSGIGRALALSYAEKDTILLLTGRNAARLEDIAQACRAKGATVHLSSVSVTERSALEGQIIAWDDAHAIDVVIANAGISGGMGKPGSEREDKFREIIATNLEGTFNTVNPLISRMQARRSGQIALLSSMAGFRGMPNAPAYSVSKCAVRAYGDALRPLLKDVGISVSVIFPGFVKTPLTDKNNFEMPFIMDAEKAARIIRHGLDRKKAYIAFPWQMHVMTRILTMLPLALSDWLLSKAPKKD